MRLELTGFAPDLDPETPGILTDCNAIIPTTQGLAAANSLVTSGLPALASTPTAAYVAELLDGTKRTELRAALGSIAPAVVVTRAPSASASACSATSC